MKIAFFNPKKLEMPTIPDAHKRTITGYVLQAIAKLDSTAAQDRSKVAELIVKEILQPSSDPSLFRMTMGKESLGRIRKRVYDYSKVAGQIESVTDSCDFQGKLFLG